MDWNNVRGTADQSRDVPTIGLLETAWMMKGPSGRILDCGIYRIATGLEVRCGYGPDDLLRSHLTRELGTARDVAQEWRQAVLAKGGFTEVKNGTP